MERKIEIRSITPYDYQDLKQAIENDPYHKDTTTVDFFYLPLTMCNVYYDEEGTILWLRLCSDVDRFVHLDIQFRLNEDGKRNIRAMRDGFPVLCSRAKEKNFKGFIFDSTSPLLKKFCTERLGFIEQENNILRKEL